MVIITCLIKAKIIFSSRGSTVNHNWLCNFLLLFQPTVNHSSNQPFSFVSPKNILLSILKTKSIATVVLSKACLPTDCFVFTLCSRWYWQKQKLKPYIDFMQRNYPPDFKYQDFAPLFTAEFFDAKEWTDIFASSGAKYIVLTTKHHEGTLSESLIIEC